MPVGPLSTERNPAALAVAVLVALLLVISVVVLAGNIAFRLRAERALERGKLEAQRYSTQLITEFHRFDYLPNLLTSHPSIIAVLNDPSRKENVDAANRYLELVSNTSSAAALYLLDTAGKTIATSNWNQISSFLGVEFSYRPYFRNAISKGEGRFYGVGTVSGTPGYFFSVALSRGQGVLGVGVVKVNLENISVYRTGSTKDIMIVDENDVVVLTSRPDLKYRTMAPVSLQVLETAQATRQYDGMPLKPIGIRTEEVLDGGVIVSLPTESESQSRSRFLAQTMPLEGSRWSVFVLSDLSEVVSFQRWTQLATALMGTTIGFFALFLMQRRRAIRSQLALKELLARANLNLEAQVAQRTQELVEANQQLRAAQDVLVHSAKLAGIGQLAAGITHELKQPLAAIRSFSENAETLIQRSQTSAASKNLRTIIDLTTRMNEIISRLKQFSRKSPIICQPVSVDDCINNSRQILAAKIKSTAVVIEVQAANAELRVLADPVRLEQVFINLISNAIDAIADVPEPRIGIISSPEDGFVVVSVIDNGSGLTEEVMAHLFEPFFTTKPAGAGLGLGLAISIGIAREFGGILSAINRDQGGAEFRLKLPILERSVDGGRTVAAITAG